jgi:hypothetical protein
MTKENRLVWPKL